MFSLLRKWLYGQSHYQKRNIAKQSCAMSEESGKTETSTSSLTRLSADQLRWRCDPSALGFSTTDELEPLSGLVGQQRALKAVKFGTSIEQPSYNPFAIGPPGTGKTTAVRSYLQKRAAERPSPGDWVYVNNFASPRKPIALQLPSGRGRRLANGMTKVVEELISAIPTSFESEEYLNHRRMIDDDFRSRYEGLLEAFQQKASKQNIALLQTQTGFVMAPKDDEDNVVPPDDFNKWPEEQRQQIEEKVVELQAELEDVLKQLPRRHKERLKKIKELNEELGELAVNQATEELIAEFADLTETSEWLQAVRRNLIENVRLFLGEGEEQEAGPEGGHGQGLQAAALHPVDQPPDPTDDPRFRPYLVNLLVSNGAAPGEQKHGAPIVEELNPTLGNLIGRIEHQVRMGNLVTDFTLLKPGALHRANGGYLLLDARKLLMQPLAWEALKRALKNRAIAMESPAEQGAITTIQSLDPSPIPLDVKVVLFGDHEIYYMLANLEPEFQLLFKVQADFDSTITRDDEHNQSYARLIAAIVKDNKLRPADVGAVARVLEHGARLAEDAEKLSVQVSTIADILREADYWAQQADRKIITTADVEQAISEQRHRADKIAEKSREQILRDIMMIDTDGSVVGQINGLSVMSLGVFAFGKPTRITASVRMGAGRVTDIEREVALGGPLHSKGIMILWGFIAARYAQDVPLSLAASLAFEQSYGGVDGDSASSTELYALLSALSGVPVKQSYAVTGSVNQHGEVQAIGGVNEKIEGFFDVCNARGLTGKQGVLIPHANRLHLMLREDIVEAVRTGMFAVHAVKTIDEGIEILTGVAAGARDESGAFAADSINARVEQTLRRFAENRRRFGHDDDRSELPTV
jgi:lon-related putative ATP-dependent protease